MLQAPEHPYYGKAEDDNNGSGAMETQQDMVPQDITELHARLWSSKVVPADLLPLATALIGSELEALPPATDSEQYALAQRSDAQLQYFAKRTDPLRAWAIFDLAALAAADFAHFLTLSECRDPAGIFGAFLANSNVPQVLRSEVLQRLSVSTQRGRLLILGAILESWLAPVLRGYQGASPMPPLSGLRSAEHETLVILGALLRGTALRRRVTSIPNTKQAFGEWVIAEASTFGTVRSAGAVREVTRESSYLDVYVVLLLREVHDLIGLPASALREVNRQAEMALFARFASVLDRTEQSEWARPFADFEFEPFVNIISPVGIDADRFRATFAGFAADAYWVLVAPGVRTLERNRAIKFTAIAALTAHETNNKDLLDAVRDALVVLSKQPKEDRVIASRELRKRVHEAVGLDLPER